MNPDHLLDQAIKLLEPPANGAPRQADKRRAISAAYYALFHAILQAVAVEFIGGKHSKRPAFSLAYRSIAHGRVRAVCSEIPKPLAKAVGLKSYWPKGGFEQRLRNFALLFVELIDERHRADYDPTFRVNTADAQRRVAQARRAINALHNSDGEQRQLLLAMIAFGG